MENLKQKKILGFTIVELLVGMSLFVVIVAIASGIFIRSVRNERRLILTNEVVDNLNSALELMGREIRGGYLFSIQNNGAGLRFKGPTGNDVTYSFDSNFIIRNGVQITSPDIKVTNLVFKVMQINSASGVSCSPWRVTISVTALPAGSGNDISPIYLQSTISSRVLPKDMPLKEKFENGYGSCN